jgi:tRNA (cmo5U34)-methyltransferase
LDWPDTTPVTSSPLACCPPPSAQDNERAYWSSALAGWRERSLQQRGLEPGWSFVAVDPSLPTLDLARTQLVEAGVSDRVETILGAVSDLDLAPPFDAAIMIGVPHHLPGNAAKKDVLAQIATRLRPEAPFVVAGNYRAYESQPLLMAAWANRWRMNGADPQEVSAKMGKILQGAEPPQSEEAVISLLTEAGFKEPVRFFASLFWGAWLARRTHEAGNAA